MADNRYTMAMGWAARGEYEAALDLLHQISQLVPEWSVPYFRIGDIYQHLNKPEKAVQAYREYLSKDTHDTLGAIIKLSLLGAATEIDSIPSSYVASLFDQYASHFDESLVEDLCYRAPQLIKEALDNVGFEAKDATILDLGCGTGLTADLFYHHATWIEGVDISSEMIAQARQKKLYHQLHVSDIHDFLERAGDLSYQLVLAADVLVYIGDLSGVMKGVAKHLASDGVFAFTCQKHDGEGLVLGADHRFSHSQEYLESVIKESGLVIRSLYQSSSRQDRGKDVDGWVCVVEKASELITSDTSLRILHPPRNSPIALSRSKR